MFLAHHSMADFDVVVGSGKSVSRHEPSIASYRMHQIDLIEPKEIIVVPCGRGEREGYKGYRA